MVKHRDAAQRGRDEIHQSMVKGEQANADAALGEQRVVLVGSGDHCVAGGQARGLLRGAQSAPNVNRVPTELTTICLGSR